MPYVFIFFSIFISHNYAVASSTNCKEIFKKEPSEAIQSNYSNLAKISYADQLDPETLAFLRNHPIFELSKKISESDPSLSFVIPRVFTHVIHKDFKGEYIQAHFLSKILRALFPHAEITNGINISRPSTTPKTTVTFNIQDTAEGATSLGANTNTRIEMLLLKSGNPQSLGTSRAELRSTLGVSLDRKVLSLYLRSERLLDSPTIQKTLHDLINKFEFHDVVISTGNVIYGDQYEHFKSRIVFLQNLMRLSEATNLDINTPPNFFYNDVLGIMPTIHAFSNLAVVVGAINFFEPLANRTPTLLWLHPESVKFYDLNALNPLIETATQTLGFRHTNEANDVPYLARELMQLPSSHTIQNPAHIVSLPTNSTPFLRLLDRIQSMICSQLNSKMC